MFLYVVTGWVIKNEMKHQRINYANNLFSLYWNLRDQPLFNDTQFIFVVICQSWNQSQIIVFKSVLSKVHLEAHVSMSKAAFWLILKYITKHSMFQFKAIRPICIRPIMEEFTAIEKPARIQTVLDDKTN